MLSALAHGYSSRDTMTLMANLCHTAFARGHTPTTGSSPSRQRPTSPMAPHAVSTMTCTGSAARTYPWGCRLPPRSPSHSDSSLHRADSRAHSPLECDAVNPGHFLNRPGGRDSTALGHPVRPNPHTAHPQVVASADVRTPGRCSHRLSRPSGRQRRTPTGGVAASATGPKHCTLYSREASACAARPGGRAWPVCAAPRRPVRYSPSPVAPRAWPGAARARVTL